MRHLFAATAMGIVLIAAAQAAAQGVRPEADSYIIPPGGCPATGHAAPIFGAFGPAGGDAQMGYEIAGPCIGLEVRRVATSLGMTRNIPVGIKNITRVRFSSEGTLNGQAVKTTAFMTFYDPSVRLIIEGAAGKQIQVVHGGQAWNETEPGVGETPAPAGAVAEREALLKLTPHGAMWSIIEAEGTVRVTRRNGKTVLTGASPYDKIMVEVTLQKDTLTDDNRPEMVRVTHGGHRYEARFYDYAEHWDTGLAPNWGMFFPSRLVWTVDGRPMADLKTTDVKHNAFMIYPRPSQIEAMQAVPERRGDLLTPVVNQLKAAAAAGQVFVTQSAVNPPYTPPATRIDPNWGMVASRSVPKGEVARMPDGKPNLTGAYVGNWPAPVGSGIYGRRTLLSGEQDQSAMQRANQWNQPLYKPEGWDRVHSMDFSEIDLDPNYHCWGRTGTPRAGPPGRISQLPNEIWLNYGGYSRIVTFNRVLNEEDADHLSWWGVSSAVWEGDTLLINSTGFTDQSWLRWQGYFHSFRMEVQERLKREGDLLYWNNTVYDPEVMIQPWTSDVSIRRLNPNPAAPEEPEICSERDADQITDRLFRG